MKKNNFKLFSLLIALMFGAVIFSACGEDRGNLTFNQTQIVMAYGQELDIADLISLDGCNISDIVFESSNKEIVLVTPRQTIVAGSKDGVAILTAQNYNGFLEIQVAGTNMQFDAPANLRYDEVLGSVLWDGVYAGETVANTFTVKITQNGQPLTDLSTNLHSAEITGDGTFEVQVKADARDGVQESEYSQVYSFTKLASPTNLQYNVKTGIVSWDAPLGVTHFYLKKDGVLSQKLSTNSFELNMLEAKTHTLSVYSATANDEEKVFGSASDSLVLTRLNNPTVAVSDGVVAWTDEQEGVTGYNVEVYEVASSENNLVSSSKIVKNGTSYSYTMPSLTQGDYVVKVCALGDTGVEGIYTAGTHYLDSAYSQTLATTKLAMQELTFNKATSTISIKDFDASANLSLRLISVLDNGSPVETDISSGSVVYDFDVEGVYTFYVLNVSKTDKEITSEKGQTLTVIKLPQITNLTQSQDQDGNYILNNLELPNATQFDVSYSYNGAQFVALTLNGSNYGKTQYVFDKVGNYEIKVVASASDTATTYVLPSTTILTATRLETNSLTKNGETITWDASGEDSNIAYTYATSGQEELSGILHINSFDLSELTVGAYTLSIRAVGENKQGVKNLILDAFNEKTIEIEIFRQLASPELAFERNGSGYNLVVYPVENATSYTITLNSQPYKVESANGTQPIIVAVEGCFAQAGMGDNLLNYSFNVYATSTNNYYKQSQTNTISIIKEFAPTTFNVSDSEVLSVNIPYSHIQKAQIIVNGNETTTLDENVNVFNVKVKYIAKIQEYDGTYYIDSDYAEFVLERLSVDIKIRGLVASWSASATSQLYTPYLKVVQGKNNYSFSLTHLPAIDLSMFNLEDLGFTLNNALVGRVECVFGQFEGNIAGKYQNGKFVSGNEAGLSKYNIGAKSAQTNLMFANSAIAINVEELATNINISWTGKSNAEYVLFDGKDEIECTQNNVEVSSSKLANVKKHILSLTEILDGETFVYVFYVNRLAKVQELTIDENENISAELITGATSIEMTKDGIPVANLKSVQEENVVISVKFKAQSNATPYEFYIDSATTDYTFARLGALNTSTNLRIYNNIISWTKEGSVDTSAYVYNVKFFDENDNSEIFVLNVETTNNVDMTEEKYQQMISEFVGKKYFTVQKYVGEFVAVSDKVNYLTSAYSTDVLLKIIDAPTNVKIELVEDSTGNNSIFQTLLKITWNVNTEGVEIAGYKVKITHNNKTDEYESTGVFNIDEASSIFKASGVWTVSVRALGLNDSILSLYSESVSVRRLNVSDSLTLTKDGVIAWGQVKDANQYMVSYTGVAGEDKWYEPKDNLTTNNFKTKLAEEFAGDVAINLYALGDGENTLTSVRSQIFTRLEKPVMTFDSEKAIFENFASYPQDSKIFIKATISSHTVLNQEITPTYDESIEKYVWYYPTSYSYIGEDGKTISVDMSVQNDIIFTFEARNEASQYIYSNSISKTLTTLSPLNNLYVVREGETIHIKATNPNLNVTKSKVKVGALSWTFDGDVDLAITDTILAQLTTTWTFDMTALGAEVDSVIYISSAISSISGQKLMNVTNITTNDGAITWSSVLNATDYKLKVDDSIYLTGYNVSRAEKLIGKQFASGDHLVNIRAIGNVGTTALATGIILDGDYSTSYSVTKLNSLSDFSVENGFFTFTTVQQATSYVIYAYNNIDENPIAEYTLQKYNVFPTEENANGYYYNANLLAKLSELANINGQSAKLYIRIFNKTTLENYVYSDFAEVTYGGSTKDYVTIARLLNSNEEVELYNPLNPSETSTDYTTTIAKWEQNMLGSNIYIVDVDGKLSLQVQNSFVLDSDGSWTAGDHTIRYCQIGSQGFDANGHAYLTADFSSKTTVNKLRQVSPYLATLQGATNELCVSYSTVSGADRYIAYLQHGDVVEYLGEYNNAGIAIMLDGIRDDITYDNFSMRAVSTQDVKTLASDLSYLQIYDDEESVNKIIKMKKMKTPNTYKYKDGTFYWEFTNEQWRTMLGDMNMVYYGIGLPLELSFNQLIRGSFAFKFTSTTSPVVTYTGVDLIRNYIYVSEEQFETLCGYVDLVSSVIGEDVAEQVKKSILEYFCGGFPSANHNFRKFANNLPAGSYNIEVKIIGSGLVHTIDAPKVYTARFSSDYASIGEKYIASAPSITAVANNGKYSLKFTNVNVNTAYFGSGISYKLYGTYYNEDYDISLSEYITTIDYANINNSKTLMFDLTDLIESGQLTSKYTNLFVSVAGNDGNILNGKTSNVINIRILNPIVAKVERGIIYWNAQEFASKYQAVYTKSGESESKIVDFAIEEGLELYGWGTGELEESSTYSITLQACGLVNASINNQETFTMSGRLTSIGTVNKLAGVSKLDNGVDIQNGLFVWSDIENATAYDVYRFSKDNKSLFIETVGNNSYYETTATNLEPYYYQFMAIGTEFEELRGSSNFYVNSDLSGKNFAQRIDTIRNISFENALISFTPTYATGYYKLTFLKLNRNGEPSEPIIVYTTSTTFDTNTHESLCSAGSYEVNIQAIYQEKRLVVSTDNCYYVISPQCNEDFVKFDKVYNINVGEYDITSGQITTHYDGGVISWNHDNTEGLDESLFEYRLVFTAFTSEDVKKGETIKTVPATQKYFEGVVFDNISTTDKIDLKIYVYPTQKAKDSVTNFVYSQPVTYGTYVGEDLSQVTYLHQYMQINENKLSVGITDKSQLKIDWTDGVSGSNIGDFTYEISFSIGGVEHEPMTTNDTYLIIGNSDEGLFADDSSTTVVFKIRVIPTSKDYISSAWTSSKEITRPNAISGLQLDETTCTITWDRYAGTSNWDSYRYKIRDEVTYTDVNGNKHVEEYIVTANIGDEIYTPFVVGSHNVSVAVMVSSSNEANTDFISAYKTIENINFNMYQLGAGTETNPYIIVDGEQFGNMQYRMSKDAKLNEYFFTSIVNDEKVVDNEKVVSSITQYYFKQEGHLTLVKNGSVDQTLYNVESTTGFNNIYDADKYSLTLDYTHIADTQDYEHISIFKTLGTNAVIKNMRLLFKLTNNELKGSGNSADISILCEQNKGKIENIMIGNVGDTIRINITYLVFSLSMLASSNYGTITNVQNNYNVVIEDKNKNVQQQINYASMAINNYASIIYVKNNGDITVSGSNMIIGGLVANNSGTSAIIKGGANKGDFEVYYKTSEASYVGGLVAKNDGTASITYCYNIGDINVQSEAGVTLSLAYVGGLIGYASNDNVSYSYVNANFTTSVDKFDIYQLIGRVQNAKSTATNVYYKANNGAVLNGTIGAGIKSFTTSPTEADLFGSGTLFNRGDLDGENPRLDWEAKLFETIKWQDDLINA